ncbi:MAG: flavodoxin family protein [Desulfobacteraceae bacterium]|nr:flavodoxin family protein [Desulfobacteraceae bacterium]
MGEEGIVLGFVGSPNKEGRTNQLITAALEGAAKAGASTELVQMADHVVTACKDCLPWVCMTNLKCTYDDDAFEYLSQKILKCGALIFGTPVYWWDTSGLVKYLILKMFRVYARSGPLQGLPAFGIGIAGGTGNGLVSGLRPVYHFFQMMQMRALEPLPATRFDFDAALKRAGELGNQIASMRKQREPFASLEERLLWYDNLPYLGLSRAAERRLLAGLTATADPGERDAAKLYGLAQADAMATAGRNMESLAEITRVYEAGVKAFEAD